MAKQAVRQTEKMNDVPAPGFRRRLGNNVTRGVVQLLAKTPVTPNMISWFGLVLTLAAASLVITERLAIAGIMVIVAGFFDMLDGALARTTNQVSKFGGILDSSLDRISEAILLLSLLPFYAGRQDMTGVWAVGLALLGSYMVSYIRARAEGAGIDCEVGVFARPERVITLALGLLLATVNTVFLTAALGIIIFFSFISAGQRLHHSWTESKK